jgi:hypothetical protein
MIRGGAGIDLRHGFGGLDQGAGGIEEQGAKHASSMEQ